MLAPGKAAPADAGPTAGQTAPPSTVAGPTPAETKRAAPLAGGGRRTRWALLGALAVAAIVVAVVFAVSRGGSDGDEDQAEARLLQVIPASVREAGCERVQGWLVKRGAEVQENCRLPSSALSEAVPDGDLTYGLFPSAGEAVDLVREDFDYEVEENEAMSCGAQAERLMEEDYPGGNAKCYRKKDGITINWSYPESVFVQLYFPPGTSSDAAVRAGAELL